MLVLDTNVASELMRPEPTPTVAAWIADRDAEDLYLTAVSEAELLAQPVQQGQPLPLSLHIQALLRSAHDAPGLRGPFPDALPQRLSRQAQLPPRLLSPHEPLRWRCVTKQPGEQRPALAMEWPITH